MKHPRLWGIATWLLSAAAGGAALILADFGAPAWVLALLLLWVSTVGLPTLLAALLVAAAYGRAPGLNWPSIYAAIAIMAAVALAFQVAAFALVSRLLKRRRARRAA